MKVMGDNDGDGDNWDSVAEGVEDGGPDSYNSHGSAEEDGSRDDVAGRVRMVTLRILGMEITRSVMVAMLMIMVVKLMLITGVAMAIVLM